METTVDESESRELVTVEIGLAEAAMRLKAGYHSAYRLLLTGALQGRKRGGRWVVTEQSVRRAIESGAAR